MTLGLSSCNAKKPPPGQNEIRWNVNATWIEHKKRICRSKVIVLIEGGSKIWEVVRKFYSIIFRKISDQSQSRKSRTWIICSDSMKSDSDALIHPIRQAFVTPSHVQVQWIGRYTSLVICLQEFTEKARRFVRGMIWGNEHGAARPWGLGSSCVRGHWAFREQQC